MSSVSSAMRARFSGGTKCSVRMLCSRSASLTSSTRTSSAMASSSLRKFSACVGLLGDEIELLDLGQALDQRADLVAEELVDLLAGGLGVLDRVVQHGRHDGGVVEPELGQDARPPRADARNRGRRRRASARRAPSWHRRRRG